MRVVLDTNVLISAFISRGVCRQVFEQCALHHELISSEELLSELKEKLATKFRYSDQDVAAVAELVQARTQFVVPVSLKEPVCRDPDDDIVLATASAGDAICIVTGDEDLLVLKQFQNIDIIRPKDFGQYEAERI